MTENSLRQFDRPADRARQDRQARLVPALFVEGEDDAHVLADLLVGVKIFSCGGRSQALEASVQFKLWKETQFACVIDQDFLAPTDATSLGDRYHPYRNADLEAMLIDLGVLDDLLAQLGSSQKLATHGGPAAVRAEAVLLAQPISALRSANAVNGWGLKFDAVTLEDKIDTTSVALKQSSFVTTLCQVSDQPPSPADIGTAMSQVPSVFRGKDVCSFVAVGLRRRYATRRDRVSGDLLAGSLRGASKFRLSTSDWLAGLLIVLST
jgi:hypothetical protein